MTRTRLAALAPALAATLACLLMAAPAAPCLASDTPPKRLAEEIMDAFIAGKTDQVVDMIYADTVGTDPGNVAAMKEQIRDIAKIYGPAKSYELVDQKSHGTSLKVYTFLALHETNPVIWRFYYYKRADGWKLIQYFTSDSMKDL